jgi:hypothetical protein
MANKYVLGNSVRLRATMLDDKDLLLDAGAVRCAVTPPGTQTPIEVAVTVIASGTVEALYVPSVVGKHLYAFTNLSPQANGEKSFLVVARSVAAL